MLTLLLVFVFTCVNLTVSDVTQIYIVILKHQLRWSVTFQCFLFGNDSVWETRKFVCNKRTKSLEKMHWPGFSDPQQRETQNKRDHAKMSSGIPFCVVLKSVFWTVPEEWCHNVKKREFLFHFQTLWKEISGITMVHDATSGRNEKRSHTFLSCELQSLPRQIIPHTLKCLTNKYWRKLHSKA